MSDLFTIICEYDGGTYIAQANASSPKDAVSTWLGTRGLAKHIPKTVQLAIKEALNEEPPVPVDDCKNVWCCGVTSGKGLVLINLVGTSSQVSSGHKSS